MKIHFNRAFTLIELLIVVAIIAILAAIAVPNFLEAQTRAKVSRARADMRTIVTALEAYVIDNNKYPPGLTRTILVSPNPGVLSATAESFTPPLLSTPVAYISNAYLPDPFVIKGADGVPNDDPIVATLFYQNVDLSASLFGNGTIEPAAAQNAYNHQLLLDNGGLPPNQVVTQKNNFFWGGQILGNDGQPRDWIEVYGSWKLGSIGPDRDYNGGANIYDSSNGTISRGDIYRTQLQTEGGQVL